MGGVRMSRGEIAIVDVDTGEYIERGAVGVDPALWATLTNSAWRESVEGIFKTGRLIVEALKNIPHGQKSKYYDSLVFSRQTANRLVSIADSSRLSNCAHARNLPASWMTLYELSTLSEAQFNAADEAGLIAPDVERKQIVAFKKSLSKTQAQQSQQIAYSGMSAGVHLGDFRDYWDLVEDESVSLIFTDPPYDRGTVSIYEDLGRYAAAKLVVGGSLITYLGDYALPEVLNHVLAAESIQFHWPLTLLHSGHSHMFKWGPYYNINVKSKLMLWFRKSGAERLTANIIDTAIESAPEKDTHAWQQGRIEAEYLISRLCPPGGLVVDPFCGGGTTAVACKSLGVPCVTFEINETTARAAAERISNA